MNTTDFLALSTAGAGHIEILDIYTPPQRMRGDNPDVRKYIDEELCPSIQDYGLIQPIVVKKHDPPLEADSALYHYELIAGWCRLQSCKALGFTHVPYAFRESLRPDQLLELELEENLRRKDFTWQEVVMGIYTTHRSKQIAASLDRETWGQKQTGKLIKKSTGYVNTALKVAEQIIAGNEEIIKANSITDAFKLIYSQKEDAVMKSLASKVGGTPSPKAKTSTPSMGPVRGESGISLSSAAVSPTVSIPESVRGSIPQQLDTDLTFDLSEMLYHSDNKLWFDEQPDRSIDFIYTDIPYGIDMDNLDFNAADLDRVAHTHDVEENVEQMRPFLQNCFRVLKDSSYLVFWYDLAHHEKLLAWGKEAGFSIQPYPIVWCKEHPCRNRAGGKWWTKAVEYAMVMSKGTSTLRAAQTRNWYLADGSAERKMQRNPFSKPFEISRKIIDAIATPGMVMADPYAGAGSLIRAGMNCGLRVKGVEKDDKMFHELVEQARNTLNAMTKGKAQFTWSKGNPILAALDNDDSIIA